MTSEEIDQLAERLAVKLNTSGSFTSTALPKEIKEWIKEAAKWGMSQYIMTTPMTGPTQMISEWMFYPDGSMQLRLCDTNRQIFWQAKFE